MYVCLFVNLTDRQTDRQTNRQTPRGHNHHTYIDRHFKPIGLNINNSLHRIKGQSIPSLHHLSSVNSALMQVLLSGV